MDQLAHAFVMFAIYGLAVLGLNLVVGFGGMMSLAHAAFFGLGAYAAVLLQLRLGWPWAVASLAAVAFAGTVAFAAGGAVLKLRADFFVLATFGIATVTQALVLNEQTVTGGAMGITAIPSITLGGWSLVNREGFCGLAWGILIIGMLFAIMMTRSLAGLVLRSQREGDYVPVTLGYDVGRIRTLFFAASACFGAGAGVLYAHYVRFIDPTLFSMDHSLLMLAMVIVGGSGRHLGSLAGTAVIVGVSELLRAVAPSAAIAANFRQLVFACVLLAALLYRPSGLAGDYDFR